MFSLDSIYVRWSEDYNHIVLFTIFKSTTFLVCKSFYNLIPPYYFHPFPVFSPKKDFTQVMIIDTECF